MLHPAIALAWQAHAQVLDHVVRQAIVHTIRQRPGIRIADLARIHGLDQKTISHHLRVLARSRIVRSMRLSRGLLWFIPGQPLAEPLEARDLAALRALVAGATSPSGVALALGVPRGTAGGLLAGLLRMGLAQREGEGWVVSARGRETLSRELPLVRQ